MTLSDAVLVKEVLDGSKDAYAELVRRYERPARAVAMHVLGNYHAAEDAAQEAFVKAYQQLGRLNRADAFGPWLMMIVRRCALDVADRKKPETSLDAAGQLPAHQQNGHLDETKQQLLKCLMQLGESERQVVMLRYFGGHTVRELAHITGRSVGTVTKQLSRAHQNLRNQIKE
ncbi:MAG TPA: sigma-70 family RNA polymerase sigma factor [Anaerohalosphaeraceae bacterium]|nr:sigma-70 family RNA polymerase sigma factor [Anaerohalosphaeraceae bacterium]